MSQPNPLCVDIDVSKATLDIAANSDIEQFTVSSNDDSFALISAELRKHSVTLVLMEAAVACSLQAEGMQLQRCVFSVKPSVTTANPPHAGVKIIPAGLDDTDRH